MADTNVVILDESNRVTISSNRGGHVGFYAAARAHSAFRSPMEHGVRIEVGGSRSSALSGRTQIFAHPTQILHPPLPSKPAKLLRGRGR